MKGALCTCDHWSDRHEDCIEESCSYGEAFHVRCKDCDCHTFIPDFDTMRERRDEAILRRYDK